MALASVMALTSCGGDDKKAPTPNPVGESTIVYASVDTKPFLQPLIGIFEKSSKSKITIKYVTTNLGPAATTGNADIIITTGPLMKSIAQEAQIKGEPQVIGWDELVIAVALGNPKGIESVRVFGADPSTTTVMCPGASPCGVWSARVLTNSGVDAAPDDVGETAPEMLDLIVTGKADAALVRRTSAASAATKIEQIVIPGVRNVRVSYKLGVRNANALAVRFATFLKSKQAAQLLTNLGYRPPLLKPPATTTTTK